MYSKKDSAVIQPLKILPNPHQGFAFVDIVAGILSKENKAKGGVVSHAAFPIIEWNS